MVTETTSAGRPRTTADTFTAQKLAALDRALCDWRVSPLDFRLLYYLASATDRQTRTAKRKQRTIADALNIKIRTVQFGLGRLRALEKISFETKEGGTYVNTYRLVLGEVNGGSTLGNKKTNSDSPSVAERRISPAEKTHPRSHKDESPFVHDLPLNPLDIPSRPRVLGALGELGSMVRSRIGAEMFDAWFGDAQIGLDSGRVGTMFLSNLFRCAFVKARFEHHILDCWRSLDPLKEKVEFVVAPC
jgi:hypothetical protein